MSVRVKVRYVERFDQDLDPDICTVSELVDTSSEHQLRESLVEATRVYVRDTSGWARVGDDVLADIKPGCKLQVVQAGGSTSHHQAAPVDVQTSQVLGSSSSARPVGPPLVCANVQDMLTKCRVWATEVIIRQFPPRATMLHKKTSPLLLYGLPSVTPDYSPYAVTSALWMLRDLEQPAAAYGAHAHTILNQLKQAARLHLPLPSSSTVQTELPPIAPLQVSSTDAVEQQAVPPLTPPLQGLPSSQDLSLAQPSGGFITVPGMDVDQLTEMLHSFRPKSTGVRVEVPLQRAQSEVLPHVSNRPHSSSRPHSASGFHQDSPEEIQTLMSVQRRASTGGAMTSSLPPIDSTPRKRPSTPGSRLSKRASSKTNEDDLDDFLVLIKVNWTGLSSRLTTAARGPQLQPHKDHPGYDGGYPWGPATEPEHRDVHPVYPLIAPGSTPWLAMRLAVHAFAQYQVIPDALLFLNRNATGGYYVLATESGAEKSAKTDEAICTRQSIRRAVALLDWKKLLTEQSIRQALLQFIIYAIVSDLPLVGLVTNGVDGGVAFIHKGNWQVCAIPLATMEQVESFLAGVLCNVPEEALAGDTKVDWFDNPFTTTGRWGPMVRHYFSQLCNGPYADRQGYCRMLLPPGTILKSSSGEVVKGLNSEADSSSQQLGTDGREGQAAGSATGNASGGAPQLRSANVVFQTNQVLDVSPFAAIAWDAYTEVRLMTKLVTNTADDKEEAVSSTRAGDVKLDDMQRTQHHQNAEPKHFSPSTGGRGQSCTPAGSGGGAAASTGASAADGHAGSSMSDTDAHTGTSTSADAAAGAHTGGITSMGTPADAHAESTSAHPGTGTAASACKDTASSHLSPD